MMMDTAPLTVTAKENIFIDMCENDRKDNGSLREIANGTNA